VCTACSAGRKLRSGTGGGAWERVEEAGVGDWDLAYAYEALARASAVAGDAAAAGEWRARARQAGDAIGDPEDREHFDEDFATL
jgi:hypothetical protein